MPDKKSRLDPPFQHLDWNLLKYFSVIVEAGGITRAAEKLGRKQSAVSLALMRLEQRLNARLCKRGPGGFALTEEGQRLAKSCAHLSDHIQHLPESIADATQVIRGPIRIRLISNLVNEKLDGIITNFNRKYSDIELLVDVAPWSNVVDALLRQEIDIGVAPSPRKRAELTYYFLFKEVHRPYCGRGHRLYGQRITSPSAMVDDAFILTGSDEPDQLSDFRLKHSLGSHVAGISEHLEEARRLAILGVGLCFLPEGYAAPDVLAGRLWPLLGKRGIPSMPIYIITNPNGPLHLSQQLFIQEFQQFMQGDTTPHSLPASTVKPRSRKQSVRRSKQ
jgi:LysR family transcriptional regulator, transcriptional activator for bauABCD operon